VIRVAGSTRVFAVIGHPVTHSLSPRMQNAAFEEAGRDAVYVPLEVKPEDLERVLDGLHRAGVEGLNVTLPHKEAAARICVTRTEEARVAGAANTLRRAPDGWHGHATDGAGFRAWVAELGLTIEEARVLLLGSGGAAASIAPELTGLGARRLTVVDRSGGRAQALVARLRLSGVSGVELSARAVEDAGAARREAPFDLLVRAISEEAVTPAEGAWWAALAPSAPTLDLNYGDRARATRERAKRDGRRFEDGLGLLLHQGARSYEFWTAERAPVEAMRRALFAVGPD
jgi:shikimate dehydrogenase